MEFKDWWKNEEMVESIWFNVVPQYTASIAWEFQSKRIAVLEGILGDFPNPVDTNEQEYASNCYHYYFKHVEIMHACEGG